MKLNNTELNVLMVALDHMQEHLDEVSKDVDMSDKIVALKSLKEKVYKIAANNYFLINLMQLQKLWITNNYYFYVCKDTKQRVALKKILIKLAL